MALDVRTAQTALETAIRDAVVYALKKRLPAVASVAALRAVPSLSTSGSGLSMRDPDDLINIVVGGAVTRAYRWSKTSTAADNGTTVVKPSDLTSQPGRWLAWTSPLRITLTVGGASQALHEIQGGVLERVVFLDKAVDESEMENFIKGAAPAVAVDARGDTPEDMDQNTGWRWDTTFDFTLYVVDENLRDSREAAQGSQVSGDTHSPGVNAIDGWLQALFGGTQLYLALDGVRNVRLGAGTNWYSKLSTRRVIRTRAIAVLATVQLPPGSSDSGAMQELDLQQQMATLDSSGEADPDNFVEEGIAVSLGVGLSKSISAGTAWIGGVEVAYAGELKTFDASSDTYRDLKTDGTLLFVTVPAGGEKPPVSSGCLRVGVTTTSASSVDDDRYLAATKRDYPEV